MRLNRFSIIKIICSICLLLILSSSVTAQYNIRDTVISFVMIGATGAYQVPGGDLAERFGSNINVGAVFQYKSKTNWLLAAEVDFFFSDDVKENHILDKFLTPDGYIIDANGQYSTVTLTERGINIQLKAGKIFPVIGPNPNSGLMTTVGLGYFQHKIYIDTPGNPVPYLEDEYRKGYDRLTTGPSINEFIGYANFSNNRLVNFYAGFEFTQAFTKNRRAMNFDTGQTEDESRFDLLFGIRLGWVFPIYKRVADKLYIN